jgi:hypothetical protein
MAITTEYSSEQIAKVDAQGRDQLNPNEQLGAQRMSWFSFNTTDETTSGTLADGDNVKVALIPKGARILGGYAIWEAMGANMDADLGVMGADGSGFIDAAGTVADAVKHFTTLALDVALAGEQGFGILQEDNYGYVAEKDLYLVLTTVDGTGSLAWDADKDFNGSITYVFD